MARVIGTVVATRKHSRLGGSKIQIVERLDPHTLAAIGEPIIAVDAVGAGAGEQVLVVQGSAARKALDSEDAPVDATIVGIIDEIDVKS